MKLKIADDLSLPLDAVTQTFLIVGKRGSGKSNTAARLVEQFHKARLPFVVLDPVDTWWGLKAGRDGEKGLDVYVFGGRKQDLPLNAGDGALIADVLCEHRTSMVLSVKHLSGRERSAFMVKFAQTLFQKWGGGPLHVVLEEAHELAPQMGGRGAGNNEDNEAAMLGAFKRLWKLGRSSGIGGSAITQRPASLSKDITTQSEILIAHRTIGPQDVAAIGQWVKYHGEKLDILAELPRLPTGEAFVWAPEFPEGKAIGLVRTAVLLRETYDSALTPKVGEQRVEPKELAPVDIERLRAKMSATIEKAKADDPRELRKQIAALKAENSKLSQSSIRPESLTKVETKTVEKFVLKDGQLRRAEGIVAALTHEVERHEAVVKGRLDLLRELTQEIAGAIRQTHAPLPRGHIESTLNPHRIPPDAHAPVRPHVRRVAPAEATSRPARVVSPSSNGNSALTNPQQRILNALAWGESMNLPLQRREKVAFLADASPKSSAFMNNLGTLRTAGLIDYPQQGYVALTDSGRALAHVDADAPTTSQEVQNAICAKLPAPQQRIVRAVVKEYPQPLSREDLAAAADASPSSSAYMNNLGSLRSLGLLDYPQQGMVAANPVLFLEG